MCIICNIQQYIQLQFQHCWVKAVGTIMLPTFIQQLSIHHTQGANFWYLRSACLPIVLLPNVLRAVTLWKPLGDPSTWDVCCLLFALYCIIDSCIRQQTQKSVENHESTYIMYVYKQVHTVMEKGNAKKFKFLTALAICIKGTPHFTRL